MADRVNRNDWQLVAGGYYRNKSTGEVVKTDGSGNITQRQVPQEQLDAEGIGRKGTSTAVSPGIVGGFEEEASAEFDSKVRDLQAGQTGQDLDEYIKGLGGEVPEELRTPRPEMADIYADPYAIESQRRALDEIAAYGRGGLRESDKQALQKGQMLQGQYLRGQREAALDQAEMRGMRGGQAQLASDIGAQQGLAQALFMQNADVNAAASDRALQALGMQDDASRGMRRDSFSEAGTRAGAADNWTASETNYARARRQQQGSMLERQADRKYGQAQDARARADAQPGFWDYLKEGTQTGLQIYGATQGVPAMGGQDSSQGTFGLYKSRGGPSYPTQSGGNPRYQGGNNAFYPDDEDA